MAYPPRQQAPPQTTSLHPEGGGLLNEDIPYADLLSTAPLPSQFGLFRTTLLSNLVAGINTYQSSRGSRKV